MADRGETAWNIPRLNLVFAVSSVALVASLAWMVWHDYDREWKDYQKRFRDLEIERTDAALEQVGGEEKEKQLAQRSEAISAQEGELNSRDAELREVRAKLIRTNGEVFDTEQRKKFAKAEADALRYQIEQERLALRVVDHREADLRAADARVSTAALAYDAALREAQELELKIAQKTDAIDKARKALAAERRDLDLLVAKREQLTSVVRQKLLNAPMLDFVKPSLEVKKVVLDDLFFPLNFTQKKRIDMCQTCHVPIDTAGYESQPVARAAVRDFAKALAGRVPVADVFVAEKKVAPAGVPISEEQAREIAASKVDAVNVALAQPLRTHPRLDLYLSAASPHPIDTFGCTVCHRGSGESLQFVAADHTPELFREGVFAADGTEASKFHRNDELVEATREEWRKDYHWHKQHHWDYPMLPVSYTEASCLQCHSNSMETIRDAAPTLYKGWRLIEDNGCYSCHKIQGWRDERRQGPTLETIASKVDRDFAYAWVSNPKEFRPTSRMPQIFHLENTEVVKPPAAPSRDAVRLEVEALNPGAASSAIRAETDRRFDERSKEHAAAAARHAEMKSKYDALGRDHAANVWDDVAVHGVVSFLFERSAPKEFPEPPVKGDATRGADEFQLAGCLACHQLGEGPTQLGRDNPYAQYGPNLAGIGSKVSEKWLYAWIKDPRAHWADTRMPNLRLADQEAADIAAYLAGLKKEGWAPKTPPLDESVLDKEALTFLQAKYSVVESEAQLKALRAGDFAAMDTKLRPTRKLDGSAAVSYFVGERWVSRMGCFSCHSIDGLQDGQAIGVELTEWGSKEVEKLDFGLLEHTYEIEKKGKHPYMNLDGTPTKGREPEHGLHHDSRIEWLAQKLRAPRSYDRGRDKPALDKWRMPNFGLSESDIQAISTYVIGLVKTGDVPPSRMHQLAGRSKTLEDGWHAIRSNNCVGCHVFEMEKVSYRNESTKGVSEVSGLVTSDDPADETISIQLWELAPGIDKETPTAGRSGDVVTIERKHVLSRERAVGGGIIPALYARYKEKESKDSTEAFAYVPPVLYGEGDKVRASWAHGFLKEPYTIRPQLKVHMPNFGLTDREATAIAEYFPEVHAADYPNRLSRQIRYDKTLTPEGLAAAAGISADQVRSIESGRKPSSDVFDKLVALARKEKVSVPDPPAVIEYVPEREEAYRKKMEALHPGYFDKALALTTPKSGNCFNCHFRGETKPTGQEGAWAPDFDRVRERLRPDWIYRWLDDPQVIYPGTKMPTLFSRDQPVFQEAFQAPREVQMGSLRDLLMNWERYPPKQEPPKVTAVTEPPPPSKPSEGK